MKRLAKLSIAATLGLATLTTGAFAVEDTTTTLDTLIIYSQGTVDEYGGDAETRINHLIATSNKIYEDSGLNIKLNPVKIQQYDMNDAATSNSVLGVIRRDTDVHKIRNDVGADTVIMFRPYAGDGACGLAYQNNSLSNPNATWVEKYAYAHVSVDCGGYVTAHEVGHNTGLGHSIEQGSTGAYVYARGHGVQDNFTTVMAYSGVYNGRKIYKYSSPALECNGLPCGIEENELNSADAVKALRQTVPLVANFREHVVIDDTNDTDGGDDDNGTIDDGADQLAAALQAYNEQQEKVAEHKIELTVLKTAFETEKEVYLEVAEVYNAKRTVHLEKRAEYQRLKASETRAVSRAYLREVYKPSARALKAFKNDVKAPAYSAYKEKVTAYKDFYKNTYKVERAKLKELKRAYRALRNA